MTCTTCRHRYATWVRGPGQKWRAISSGDSYAESESAAERWLREHADELTGPVETFTAVANAPLPSLGDV